MAGAVLLAGCGTKPKTDQSSGGLPAGASPTLSPTTPAGAPTAAGPTSTLANKPGCAESARLGILILAITQASADKRAEVSQALDQTASNLKQAVPQLADSIDTQVAVAKRAAEGKSEPSDAEKVKAAGEPYQKWFDETCTKP
ncbi:MAG: hypothetical protein R2726_07120 [Acidimicrobiales bacterium]